MLSAGENGPCATLNARREISCKILQLLIALPVEITPTTLVLFTNPRNQGAGVPLHPLNAIKNP